MRIINDCALSSVTLLVSCVIFFFKTSLMWMESCGIQTTSDVLGCSGAAPEAGDGAQRSGQKQREAAKEPPGAHRVHTHVEDHADLHTQPLKSECDFLGRHRVVRRSYTHHPFAPDTSSLTFPRFLNDASVTVAPNVSCVEWNVFLLIISMRLLVPSMKNSPRWTATPWQDAPECKDWEPSWGELPSYFFRSHLMRILF